MWLSMNTNAGAREETWWAELARVFGRKGAVIFSVDGLEDTNPYIGKEPNWKIVERSADAFIEAGGRVLWDFLVPEHNPPAEEAEALSKQKGFERFIAKKTGRFIDANPK